VPTAIRTTTRAESTSETPATTPTSTVSLPTGDKSSSTRSTTVRRIATSTLPPTATTNPEAAEGQPRFTSTEIAGIALGCAAVLVFGVLLVVLGRCIRRRRYGDLEAGFSRMRDSMSFGRKSRRGSDPGALQISSPLPRVHVERDPLDPRWHPQVPQMKQPKQVKQVGLGLPISPYDGRGGRFVKPSPALASVLSAPLPPTPATKPAPAPALTLASPPRSVPKVVLSPASEPRVTSAEQSPPKPALTLAIPKEQQRVPRVPPPNARDSVVTEFAEDGEADITPGTAIWRPPATDPQSATTVYFADKGGNWILRNPSSRRPEAGSSRRVSGPMRPVIQEVAAAPVEVELPSPDHKTRAEQAKDAYGGFSPDAVVSPLRLPRKPGQGRLGSPIAFKDQRREPQLSSPSLSARMSQSAQTIQSELEQTKDRHPEIYFTMMRESRDLTGGRSKRRSVRRANRPVSQASATSIESAADDEDVIEDELQVDLSPVAESPHTPISPGKSPVKYPEIRKQKGGQQTARPNKAPESDLLPPGHKYNVWHPPGRSSPTGSSSFPRTRTPAPAVPRSNDPNRPWNAPDLKPRNPAQPRTGSPEARPGPASPGQSWQRQRQVANPASYWNQQQSPPPTRVRPPPPPTPPYELPGENTPPRRYDTPPQQQQQQRRPMRPTDPRQLPTPASTPQPQPKPQQQQQQQQPQPRPSVAGDIPNQTNPTQPQSSLLAKRRGADKVPAALTLANNSGNQKRGGGAGAGAGAGKGKSGWTREVELGPVPITPGWVPELTPTRRGEDLYLNVR
jgi:hypothetical protein